MGRNSCTVRGHQLYCSKAEGFKLKDKILGACDHSQGWVWKWGTASCKSHKEYVKKTKRFNDRLDKVRREMIAVMERNQKLLDPRLKLEITRHTNAVKNINDNEKRVVEQLNSAIKSARSGIKNAKKAVKQLTDASTVLNNVSIPQTG